MGHGSSAPEAIKAEDIGEVSSSSGFHLFELHLPSVTFSLGMTIIIVAVVAVIFYCCWKKRGRSHRNRRDLEVAAFHSIPQAYPAPTGFQQHHPFSLMWDSPSPYSYGRISTNRMSLFPEVHRERQARRPRERGHPGEIDDDRIEEVEETI